MKTLATTFLAFLFVSFSMANPGEEAVYESVNISYNVEKTGGQVYIQLDLKNPQQYSVIQIERSNEAIESYRRIKYLGTEEISEMGATNVIVDKYPLSSRENAYYKIVTIDEYGIQKTYPAVLVSKN